MSTKMPFRVRQKLQRLSSTGGFRSMPPIPMMVPPIGTAIIPSNALECLHGE